MYTMYTIHIYTHYIYIYLYMERERERDFRDFKSRSNMSFHFFDFWNGKVGLFQDQVLDFLDFTVVKQL